MLRVKEGDARACERERERERHNRDTEIEIEREKERERRLIAALAQFEFDGFVFVSKQEDRVSSSAGNTFQPNKLPVESAFDYTNIIRRNGYL